MNKTKIIKNYLENNPEATYAEFKESGPKTAVSGQYFYAVRKNLRGGIGRRTKNPIYVAVFSRESSSISPDAKALLQEFLSVLNTRKKSRLELVEYTQITPHTLEVREAQ
jgi:hypothetical protein